MYTALMSRQYEIDGQQIYQVTHHAGKLNPRPRPEPSGEHLVSWTLT